MSVLDYLHSISEGNPTPEATHWLSQGFKAFLSGDSDTLSEALGFEDFKPSARKAYRKYLRDALIREISDEIAAQDDSRTSHSVAGEIINRLNRVIDIRAPRNELDKRIKEAYAIDPVGWSLTNIRSIITTK